MKIGKRALTNTPSSRMMTFDRDYLDEIGFTAGNYIVIYEPNKVSIVKEIKDVIIVNESESNKKSNDKSLGVCDD